jgi:6-phosphogluconolactonase/glucosamine-6-phosphate isomerase/deaminase
MKLLTVAQTDERYGPVGHPDSNWKQMQDEGFDFEGVRDIPILTGEALQDTVDEYERAIVPIFDEIEQAGGMIVGQFGMGTDGHIAGIQPHTPAVNSSRLVSGYEWKPFTRVTLTFPALMKIDAAYVFVFGESKRDAVTKLKAGELPLDEEPAQILKNMREVHFYSDLI